MYVYNSPVAKAKIEFTQNKGTGITGCSIFDYSEEENPVLVSSKTAKCSFRERSGFVPKKGKKTALLYAMKAAGWNKKQREHVWRELDNRGWLREGEKFRG